jgi:hypothetical protein
MSMSMYVNHFLRYIVVFSGIIIIFFNRYTVVPSIMYYHGRLKAPRNGLGYILIPLPQYSFETSRTAIA